MDYRKTLINISGFRRTMKTLLTFPALIALAFSTQAQTSFSERFSDSVRYYHELIVQTDYDQMDSMHSYINKMEAALDQSNLSDISVYHSLRGIYFQRMSNYDSAIAYQNKSLELAESALDSFLIAKANQRLGVIYKYLGDFDLAVEYFTKAKTVAYQLGDFKTWASSDITIAQSYNYLGKYNSAIEQLKEVIEEARERSDHEILYATLIERGNASMMTGKLDEALNDYLESEDLMKKIGATDGMVAIIGNIGAVYFFNGDYSKAIEYYKKSIALGRQYDDKISTATGTMNLAEALYTIGKYDEASDSLLSTLKVYKLIDSKNHIVYNYDYLYKLEEKRKNYGKAISYLKLKNIYQDSILNENTLNRIAELQTQYNTAKKERQLAQSELEIQTKEATIASQQNTIILIVSGAGFVLLIGLVLYNRNRAKQREKTQQAVLEEKEKGFNSVVQATEEERKRISKDLHDGIGQQLTALKLALTNFTDKVSDKNKPELQQITMNFTQSADDVRAISHQMMPRALMENGLVEAIEDLLKESFRFSDISFEFEHRLKQDRLDEKVEISLYRITQELINNIIKHSGATAVNVQLIQTAKQLSLFVEDNGKGMTEEKSDGHGLLNIKSRLDLINGEVNFEPSPESGTSAVVNVPIR